MTEIRIGGRTLACRPAASADAAIAAATGCSAAEIAAMLERGGHAAQLAQALHPLLVEALPLAEIGAAIAEGDVHDVRAQLLALYSATPPAEAAE